MFQESDLAGEDANAETISTKLYAKLIILTRSLMIADGVTSLSFSEPRTDNDKDSIKRIAGFLIGAGAGAREVEVGEVDVREEGMQWMLTCIRGWVCDRASTASQQVTAFFDAWIQISTVLLLKNLFKSFTS